MSNSKKTSAGPQPSETVEQQTPESNVSSGDKKTEENSEQVLMKKATTKAKDLKKKTSGLAENGNVESPSNEKRRKKRKFPSREEISKVR